MPPKSRRRLFRNAAKLLTPTLLKKAEPDTPLMKQRRALGKALMQQKRIMQKKKENANDPSIDRVCLNKMLKKVEKSVHRFEESIQYNISSKQVH